jgi:hypothetical protein
MVKKSRRNDADGQGAARGLHMRRRMWIIVALVLFAGWLALKVAWHVGSFAVHVLLGLAVIAMVMHFVRGHFGGGKASAGT